MIKYSFTSVDGVLHRNFKREDVLLWYYDGKIKPDAVITKWENKKSEALTIESLEPDDSLKVPNSSGLRDARPKGRIFNLGAMMLAPFWTIAYRMWPLCTALWVCCLLIGLVAWASSEHITVNTHFLFRIDAVSHAVLWILSVYIGIAGNRTAWQSRRFESAESFRRCMKIWQIAGAVILALVIVGFAVYVPAVLKHNGLMQ